MNWRIAIGVLVGSVVGGFAGGGHLVVLGGLLGFIAATVSLGAP